MLTEIFRYDRTAFELQNTQMDSILIELYERNNVRVSARSTLRTQTRARALTEKTRLRYRS